MQKNIRILLLAFCCIALPVRSTAQLTDAGGIGTISVSKGLGRYWDVKAEQELRFNQSYQSFDRSLTALMVDYTLLPKILKAGLEYDFIYQKQTDIFEFRHRASLALSTQFKVSAFDINLRTRYQATWRDNNRGDYNYNPRNVWRNKVECTYNIFGSPVKPSVSAELFCPLNGSKGFHMDSYRLKLAVRYKYSAHQSIEAFIRYDAEIQKATPNTILYTGLGWNYKL